MAELIAVVVPQRSRELAHLLGEPPEGCIPPTLGVPLVVRLAHRLLQLRDLHPSTVTGDPNGRGRTAGVSGRVPVPEGTAWSIENVLALVAVVGVASVVPYVVALHESGIALADPGIEINLLLLGVGSLTVLAVVWVPGAHEWVVQRF